MLTVEEIRKKNLPANLYNIYSRKVTSSDEAVKKIKSGDNIVVQPGCAVPLELIRAMVRRKDELENVTIYHILIVGELPYVNPGMEKHFKHKAFFVGANVRKSVQEGRSEFIPIFLSEVPLLFKRNIIPVEIALLNVSPPDEHGFCSYGVDVGTIKSAAERAKIVIAQINPEMPRSLGDSFIHINKIHHIVEHSEPIQELPQVDPNTTEEMLQIYDAIEKTQPN